MSKLSVIPTESTPSIELDSDTGIFRFEGKSYPENVNETYKETLDFIEAYKQNPKRETTLIFNWFYFNTATFKVIAIIIMRLKNETNLTVEWYCKKGFDSMIKKGEEIKTILDVNLVVLEIDY
jgi:hypothetical protein